MDKPIVLVLDAEALIRISAVHMLEDAKFLTLEASNAAIAIWENRRDIGAAFTDINISGSTCGLKRAHTILGRWPPISLPVTSGQNMLNQIPIKGRFIRKHIAPKAEVPPCGIENDNGEVRGR